EALPPAVVKGKADPIRVWRVLGDREARPAVGAAFVGREHELRLLGQLFDRVVQTNTGQLVTVVGEPGMGKTGRVEGSPRRTEPAARWLSGRCVPYGESVTLAPVADMVRDVAGLPASGDPAVMRARLRDLVSTMEHEEEDGRRLLVVLQTI